MRGFPTGGLRLPLRCRRRGVSPVIALVLLVAITVVLAAVLYVLVSGFAHTTTTMPLGSALSAGPATGSVGATQTNSYCQSKHYCYAVPIDEVGGGLTLGDLNFVVRAASGSLHIVAQNSAQLSIVNEQGLVVADSKVAKNAAFEVTTWQKLAPGTTTGTALSNLQTIWVQFGNTKASPFGQGDVLEIVGTGPFSGSVIIPLP